MSTITIDAAETTRTYAYNLEVASVAFTAPSCDLPLECFRGCTALADVVLPPRQARLPEKVFLGCRALASVVLPEGMQALGPSAFQNTGLVSVVLPASVDTVGSYCFAGCPLESVVVHNPAGIQLGNRAFPAGATVTVPHDVGTEALEGFRARLAEAVGVGVEDAPVVRRMGPAFGVVHHSLPADVRSILEDIERFRIFEDSAQNAVTAFEAELQEERETLAYLSSLDTSTLEKLRADIGTFLASTEERVHSLHQRLEDIYVELDAVIGRNNALLTHTNELSAFFDGVTKSGTREHITTLQADIDAINDLLLSHNRRGKNAAIEHY